MTPERLEQLREMGKKGQLWKVHALVDVIGVSQLGDVAHWERVNLTWEGLNKVREHMFDLGVLVNIGPTSYVLIPPRDIRTIWVERQSKFFEK